VGHGKARRSEKESAPSRGISFNGKPHELTSRLRPYRERPALKVISATSTISRGLRQPFLSDPPLCHRSLGLGQVHASEETLYQRPAEPSLQRQDPAGACVSSGGMEALERVLEVDHSPSDTPSIRALRPTWVPS